MADDRSKRHPLHVSGVCIGCVWKEDVILSLQREWKWKQNEEEGGAVVALVASCWLVGSFLLLPFVSLTDLKLLVLTSVCVFDSTSVQSNSVWFDLVTYGLMY